MSKMFIIGLIDNGFGEFKETINSYKLWCEEKGEKIFKELNDFNLDFLTLDDFQGSGEDNFDCFDNLENLETWFDYLEDNEKQKTQVLVIYDVYSFDNYTEIVNKLKSNYRYLEYELKQNDGEDVFDLETFIIDNCIE